MYVSNIVIFVELVYIVGKKFCSIARLQLAPQLPRDFAADVATADSERPPFGIGARQLLA